MHGALYFYLCLQIRLRECVLHNVFVCGRVLIVIFRDGDQELRLGFRGLKMRAVGHFGYEGSAVRSPSSFGAPGAWITRSSEICSMILSFLIFSLLPQALARR